MWRPSTKERDGYSAAGCTARSYRIAPLALLGAFPGGHAGGGREKEAARLQRHPRAAQTGEADHPVLVARFAPEGPLGGDRH